MALSLSQLGAFCDTRKLAVDTIADDVYLLNGVSPYRSAGISEQFLNNADVYHERYFSPNHFEALLDNAFQAVGESLGGLGDAAILDLGSGSGNTAIPLLTRNAGATLIATDLSIDLLRIMATLIKGEPFEDRIGYLCADANETVFNTESFDYVVGASILHHLLQPEKALSVALSYLKLGGKAIFFEPFEYGCNIMKTIYSLILDDPRSQSDLSAELAGHFQAMIRDYNARFDATTEKPYTAQLDDKWLFTRAFFEDVARANGCTVVSLVGNNHRDGQYFQGQLLGNLQLAGVAAPPHWCTQVAAEFDDAIPDSLIRKLIVDGTIVIERVAAHLEKPASVVDAPIEQPTMRSKLRSLISRR